MRYSRSFPLMFMFEDGFIIPKGFIYSRPFVCTVSRNSIMRAFGTIRFHPSCWHIVLKQLAPTRSQGKGGGSELVLVFFAMLLQTVEFRERTGAEDKRVRAKCTGNDDGREEEARCERVTHHATSNNSVSARRPTLLSGLISLNAYGMVDS
jgi:hypothetical protein